MLIGKLGIHKVGPISGRPRFKLQPTPNLVSMRWIMYLGPWELWWNDPRPIPFEWAQEAQAHYERWATEYEARRTSRTRWQKLAEKIDNHRLAIRWHLKSRQQSLIR